MTLNALKTQDYAQNTNRLNFLCILGAETTWPLGLAFFATTTIGPLFLAHLNAGNILIGFLPGLIYLCYFGPGLLVAGRVSRLSRALRWLVGVAVLERLPLFGIVALTMLWGRSHPGALLVAFFVLYGAHAFCTGLNLPAYWVVIGKTIPMLWRGRLYGYAGLIAGIAGLGIDPITRHFLRGPSGGFPDGFAGCFLIGSLIVGVGMLPLAAVKEPEGHTQRDPHAGHYTGDGLQVLRQDANLRRTIAFQTISAFRFMPWPFYVLACVARFHVGAESIAVYTAITVMAGGLGSFLWGLWGDRRGNREVLLAAQGVGVVAGVLALLAPTAAAFNLVFAGAALCMSGIGLAGNNLVMELAPSSQDIPLYTALNNAIPTPFAVLAPLLGGVLADHFGYSPAFAIAAVALAASFGITLAIREPRHAVG